VYVGQALGGSGWAKVIAPSLALSVIASTGTAFVIIARMAYGMARQRVLPLFLGNVSYRFSSRGLCCGPRSSGFPARAPPGIADDVRVAVARIVTEGSQHRPRS
jgi:hypothetical protein